MKYFDYVFFRIHTYYMKKKDIPIFTGILFLIALQWCQLFLVMIVINLITGDIISADYIDKGTYYTSGYGLLALCFLMNSIRYGGRNKALFYHKLFKESKLNDKIPTWLIFIQPILFLLLSFLIIGLARSLK